MNASLFSFIWEQSKRQQILLSVLTLCLFPLLYITLELPKRIINDAIGAQSDTVVFFGLELPQLVLLGVLCIAFLVSVIAHGLLKMRINTMKGVTAERLLQRFRFMLIQRITRFPKPYFQAVSQGELVSMVTAESEPMGGMMGDAISQPLMQAGQMITILGFLFLQSFWFGLASVALIPLQAWLIPHLQAQINKLNKQRIQQVRGLSTEVGETAAGAGTLLVDGGRSYRLAQIRYRLAQLFAIRYRIYRKKFFMKFLNNLIGQLTPFFFFSIGGYLVIQGSVTIGALVAALAAYKDLSSPWKELLTYYTQIQEMSQRWHTITERFAPRGLIDEEKLDDSNAPAPLPRLRGDIVLENLGVMDADGHEVLKGLDLRIPQGSSIGIRAPQEEERRALVGVLTRDILPARGEVRIGEDRLADLHQRVIAARIGAAGPSGYVFRGSVAENLQMPLLSTAQAEISDTGSDPEAAARGAQVPSAQSWLTPGIVGLSDPEAVTAWWQDLVATLDPGRVIFRRAQTARIDPARQADLARSIVDLRTSMARKIAGADLSDALHRFDPEAYNPALTVIENLLFALPRQKITPEVLLSRGGFLPVLEELGIRDALLDTAFDIIELLNHAFGADGTDHPLFDRLHLDPALYQQVGALAQRHGDPEGNAPPALTPEEVALLLSVPFQVAATELGSDFSPALRDRVLTIRREQADRLRAALGEDLFEPLEAQSYNGELDLAENLVFGRFSKAAAKKSDSLRRLAGEVLSDAGLERPVTALFLDIATELEGRNLSAQLKTLLCLCRAAIRHPDVLLLDNALGHLSQEERATLRAGLRQLMPDATFVVLEPDLEASDFDITVELVDGRLPDQVEPTPAPRDQAATADLQEKLRQLQGSHIFATLDRKQLRLLAFGAQWFRARAGETVFEAGAAPDDGAYLITEGTAGLYRHPSEGGELVAEVGPGVLLGELGLITDEPRKLEFRAHGDLVALRLGSEEFLSVAQNDAGTSFKLLRVVAGYLSSPKPTEAEKPRTVEAADE